MAGRNHHRTCGRCKQGIMVVDLGSDLRCVVCGFVIYGNDLSKEILGYSIERRSVNQGRGILPWTILIPTFFAMCETYFIGYFKGSRMWSHKTVFK